MAYRLVLFLLATWMLGTGCRPSTPDEPLLPVSLPSLEGLAESAQQQLRQQHDATTALRSDVPPSAQASTYGKMGQLLFTYDFLDAAEPAFRNARALNPRDIRWTYYLGILHRQRGDLEQAATLYEEVLEDHPNDALTRLRLAEASMELGQTETAQSLLETLKETQPRNAFALFLLGQLAYEAGAFETAVAYYEDVLRLQPTATQVHTPLGLAYRNLGNQEQSAYHLDRRGTALVQLNDPRVQELEAFKQSSGATALTRGQDLIDTGRFQEAIAVLEQATAQNPENASAYLSLGVARSYAGDQPGAIAAFGAVLSLDSTESKAHYNLAAIYEANDEPALAEHHFRAAIAVDPFHRGAHLELAERLRRTGRCREAVGYFERVLELDPGGVAARQQLALCQLQLGRAAEARTLLEDGLAGTPNHLGFTDALARILAASPDDAVRDGERALDLAQQALALQRRTETLETIAMAYAELERFDEAVAWQNQAIEAVEHLGHQAYLDHLNATAGLYRQKTPCRTPWPDFMYTL